MSEGKHPSIREERGDFRVNLVARLEMSRKMANLSADPPNPRTRAFARETDAGTIEDDLGREAMAV